MKKLIIPIFIVFISIIFVSCRNNSRKEYTIEKDGLIYKNHKVFSGEIIDTVGVIIQYAVINGKKNGLFITRYLSGQLEKIGFIKDNKNTGEWKYFYPSGKLESIGEFENSIAEGKWIFYYPNGSIKMEGDYLNGKKDKQWILFNQSGQIINIIFFQNDKVIMVQNRVS